MLSEIYDKIMKCSEGEYQVWEIVMRNLLRASKITFTKLFFLGFVNFNFFVISG